MVLFFAVPIFSQDDDVWTQPKQADFPEIVKTGATVSDFVPAGFKIVKSASGDLNGDKTADTALHLIGTFKQFLNKNENLGSDVFDTNPRMLVILFRDKIGGAFSLAEQSNTFIITPDSPVSSEPFQDISIKAGILKIDFELWQSAGGWGATNASYKFRFQNGEFALVGAERTDYMRNTGKSEKLSYNFLTGRVNATTGNISNNKKRKSTWKKIKIDKLRNFKTFPTPFEWEIEPGTFI